MTHAEAEYRIEDRLRAAVAPLEVLADPTRSREIPAAGGVLLEIEWGSELASARSMSSQLAEQVATLSAEIHLPEGAGKGALLAIHESIAAAFRGLADGDLDYLGAWPLWPDKQTGRHARISTVVLIQKLTSYPVNP